mmetsp:Transcript_2819/g.7757  ORF Transcript_2819/g.7757 Transcript_2819/m.7757 type:complete len:234 (+) Transcript_2819:2527-3228(+)
MKSSFSVPHCSANCFARWSNAFISRSIAAAVAPIAFATRSRRAESPSNHDRNASYASSEFQYASSASSLDSFPPFAALSKRACHGWSSRKRCASTVLRTNSSVLDPTYEPATRARRSSRSQSRTRMRGWFDNASPASPAGRGRSFSRFQSSPIGSRPIRRSRCSNNICASDTSFSPKSCLSVSTRTEVEAMAKVSPVAASIAANCKSYKLNADVNVTMGSSTVSSSKATFFAM